MTEQKEEKELLAISSGDAAQPFRWSVGKHGSKFLAELRDHKKIFGIKCPKCKRVYIPPHLVCGRCHVAMDELVELSEEGEIISCTIIQFSFVDPSTGIQRPVPYGYGFVRLDGADSAIPHFFDSTDPAKVKVGARVKAVFEEKRTGSIMDIKHFSVL